MLPPDPSSSSLQLGLLRWAASWMQQTKADGSARKVISRRWEFYAKRVNFMHIRMLKGRKSENKTFLRIQRFLKWPERKLFFYWRNDLYVEKNLKSVQTIFWKKKFSLFGTFFLGRKCFNSRGHFQCNQSQWSRIASILVLQKDVK